MWPNLLVQSILIPTSSIASLGVSSSETFGRNLPCKMNIPSGPSLSLVSTGFYCVCGPLFCFLSSLLLLIRDPDAESSRQFLSWSTAPMRRLSSIFLTTLTYVRIILTFPVSRQKSIGTYEETACCVLLWAFLLAQVLFWVPVLSLIALLITFCLIREVVGITGCTTVGKTFEDLAVKGCTRHAVFFLIWLVFFLPVVVLYIQGCELLMFVLLSSISLYISFPLQTFLVVSWSLALVAEAQSILHDYRSPMLAMQEAFSEKCFTLAKNHIGLERSNKNSINSRPCLKKESASGQSVDWENFLRQSEKVWDNVCFQLLTFHDFDVRHHGFESLENTEHVRNVLNMLDVRHDWERSQNEIISKSQKILWMRFFKGMVKLLFLVVLFLSIIVLLLAFNSLWTGPNPKDTSSLLLTILVVPLYTFVRTKLTSTSLTDFEKQLVERGLDVGLDACFQNSLIKVSPYCLESVLK